MVLNRMSNEGMAKKMVYVMRRHDIGVCVRVCHDRNSACDFKWSLGASLLCDCTKEEGFLMELSVRCQSS